MTGELVPTAVMALAPPPTRLYACVVRSATLSPDRVRHLLASYMARGAAHWVASARGEDGSYQAFGLVVPP